MFDIIFMLISTEDDALNYAVWKRLLKSILLSDYLKVCQMIVMLMS